jgi:hypothetical protein
MVEAERRGVSRPVLSCRTGGRRVPLAFTKRYPVMGHALLWIESLAVVLVLLAAITACTARWASRPAQAVLPVLTALLLLVVAGIYTYAVDFLRSGGALEDYPVRYAGSWTLALALGSIVVLFRGLRRTPPDGVVAGRAWPRARLAVALVALGVVTYITFTNLDMAVKFEMASVRAEAGSRAVALAPPRVPDRDNAALLYQQAFESITPREKVPASQRERWFGQAWDDSTVSINPKGADLKKFLARQQRGLALLRKAAVMPDCWFGHDYHDGFGLLLPELERMRDGARLLLLNALVEAHDGNSRAALRDISLVFRMARHLNDPTLITFLTARTIERDGTRALEEVLAVTAVRPEELAPLLAEGESHSREELLRTLRMEEAAGAGFFATLTDSADAAQALEQFAGPRTGRYVSEGIARWVVRSSFYRVFFLSDDLAAYRRGMRRFQEAVAHPYYQAQRELDRFEREFRAHQGGILTKLLMPAVVKCASAAAMGEAFRELRRLALAVTAYRVKNGKFPDRIDDLAPAHLARVPLDPFDGQPLRLKRDGKDLILYSIGPDLRDDGGAAFDPKLREGDLVFRLRGR